MNKAFAVSCTDEKKTVMYRTVKYAGVSQKNPGATDKMVV